MNWLAGFFGFFLVAFGTGANSTPAPGTRPYMVIIGAVLLVLALCLHHREKLAEQRMLAEVSEPPRGAADGG